MTLFFGILLLILTIVITGLPFFGSLMDRRKKGLKKFTPLGKGFLTCILLLLIVGVYREFISEAEGSKKDKINSEIHENVRKIKGVTDTVLQELQSLDSITNLLSEVNKSTSKSLEERERVLKEFNEINKKIKAANEYERLKFNAERSEITLLTAPYFSLIDSTRKDYNLNLKLMNAGMRTASNIEITAILFNVQGGSIKSGEKLAPVSTADAKMPSYNKNRTGQTIVYGLLFENYKKIEKSENWIYLFFSVKYVDDTTKEKGEFIEFLAWRGFRECKYEMITCTPQETTIIKEYIKQNTHLISK